MGVEAMKKYKAEFGFESNGGGISGEIFYGRDGGSTLIKMLNLLKKEKRTLSQLVSSLPQFYIFKEKVDFGWCAFRELSHLKIPAWTSALATPSARRYRLTSSTAGPAGSTAT